jgi:hypothetical protein
MDIRMHRLGFALGGVMALSLSLAQYGPAAAPGAAGRDRVSLPAGVSFDHAAAVRGDELLWGSSQCARCHVEPLSAEPYGNLPEPEAMGLESFQADAPDGIQAGSPLVGLLSQP